MGRRKVPVNPRGKKKTTQRTPSKPPPGLFLYPLSRMFPGRRCPVPLSRRAAPGQGSAASGGIGAGLERGPEEKRVALTGVEVQALSRVFIVP